MLNFWFMADHWFLTNPWVMWRDGYLMVSWRTHGALTLFIVVGPLPWQKRPLQENVTARCSAANTVLQLISLTSLSSFLFSIWSATVHPGKPLWTVKHDHPFMTIIHHGLSLVNSSQSLGPHKQLQVILKFFDYKPISLTINPYLWLFDYKNTINPLFLRLSTIPYN